jgi:hypothetical protein
VNLINSFSSKCGWFVVVVIAVNAIALSVSAVSIPVQSFHKDADGVTLAMSPGTFIPPV